MKSLCMGVCLQESTDENVPNLIKSNCNRRRLCDENTVCKNYANIFVIRIG